MTTRIVWSSAALGAALLAGLTASFVNGSPTLAMAITSVGAIPLLLWGSARAPELVVGVIVYAQILEYFEFDTPLGTISLGIVALVLLLAVRLPLVIRTITRSGYTYAVALFLVYVAAHAAQFMYVDAGVAFRGMITASSFAAFAILGMYVGGHWKLVTASALGATLALLSLAAIGLAAGLGLIPYITATGTARELLGITAPFARSYGLSPTNAGLLVALSVPWLASVTRFGHSRTARIVALVAIGTVWLASLLIFQSRSMILESSLGALLVWLIAERKARTVLLGLTAVGVAGLAAGAYLVTGQDSSSMISSQLRLESYATAFGYLMSHVQVLLIGTNPVPFHLMVNSTLTFGSQIPAAAPVHNFLVETLVLTGFAGAGALVLIIALPLSSLARTLLSGMKADPLTSVALAAGVMAIIEASVTPAGANSAALWMALGWLVAAAARFRAAGRGVPVKEARMPGRDSVAWHA